MLTTTETPLPSLAGVRVLITSGPTVEPIDPVRYISNYSSGKMGAALAQAAADAGAEVTVITGPVAIEYDSRARVVPVQTACEMHEAALAAFSQVDVAICAAAVSDFRPVHTAAHKLKKGNNDDTLRHIELVENPDILAALGHAKQPHQLVIGFAAETQQEVQHARDKLIRKGADFMVANNVAEQSVFGADTNSATLVFSESERALGSLSKIDLAHAILQEVSIRRGLLSD